MAGPTRAPVAVVFVHGNPGSSRDFLGLMAATRRLGLRMVSFDLPGFGRSARLWAFPYTVDGYTRWFTRALAQLRIRRAILVVHDVGGPLGMQWASQHASKFIATAIIDSGVLVGYQDHYLARIWKAPVLGEALMAAVDHPLFNDGAQQGQQRPLPRPFVSRMYAEYDRVTRCAVLSAYRSIPDVDAFARRQSAALRPVNRPALVVWGAHDPYLPTRLAYAQRDTFPSAQIHILANAAHWPFVDDPARVARWLTAFLGEVKRGLGGGRHAA